jgi:rRNA-processing protein FCF1
MAGKGIFIIDANVLIDYINVDASVLTLIADHLGPVNVPRRILQELKRQRPEDADYDTLGLTVVTEEYAELVKAADMKGPLSFQDHLMLILAKGRGWTAITNDGGLRKALERVNVPKRWGPEIMLELVSAGYLAINQAVTLAERIAQANPRYADVVLAEFKRKIVGLNPARKARCVSRD